MEEAFKWVSSEDNIQRCMDRAYDDIYKIGYNRGNGGVLTNFVGIYLAYKNKVEIHFSGHLRGFIEIDGNGFGVTNRELINGQIDTVIESIQNMLNGNDDYMPNGVQGNDEYLVVEGIVNNFRGQDPVENFRTSLRDNFFNMEFESICRRLGLGCLRI